MKKNISLVKSSKSPVLPVGINASDLEMPKDFYKKADKVPYDDRQFEIWFTERMGWCIPTLRISRARRANTQDRTYAVMVNGGGVCRIGKGPHVVAVHTVYVTNARHASLQKFLDLRQKGAGDAGQIRDRISSRRAQGQMERASGNRSWRWDV